MSGSSRRIGKLFFTHSTGKLDFLVHSLHMPQEIIIPVEGLATLHTLMIHDEVNLVEDKNLVNIHSLQATLLWELYSWQRYWEVPYQGSLKNGPKELVL